MESQHLLHFSSAFHPSIKTVAWRWWLFLLVACLLRPACGLQVTPNSACASVCLDNPAQDVSDPNVSNTFGSDIVCFDEHYAGNPVGQKFQNCINCLQSSNAVGSGENDQGWLLYNLRFALTACLFGSANATDPESSPCSLDSVCGPIHGALQDGMQNPSTMAQYSYCSAFSNSFVGASRDVCSKCLRVNHNQMYLSNFITALYGGCVQRPPPGTLVGLNSSVFSPYEVKITSPVTSTGSKGHKKISEDAIIGIVIGGVILILIIIAVAFVCIRKRRTARRLNKLRSPLNSRYGAQNITAPHTGDYSSADKSLSLLKEEYVPMNPTPPPKGINFSRQIALRDDEDDNSKAEQGPPTGSSSPPIYSPLSSGHQSIPTHHAYSPRRHPSSPRDSTSPLFHPPSSESHPHPFPTAPTPYRSSSINSSSPRPYAPPKPTQSQTSTPAATPSQPLKSARSAKINILPPNSIGNLNHNTRNSIPIQPHPTRSLSSASREPRGNTANPVQISGPYVHVGPRFGIDDQEQERGMEREQEQAKRNRERLYRDGLLGFRRSKRGSPERGGTDSGTESDGLW